MWWQEVAEEEEEEEEAEEAAAEEEAEEGATVGCASRRGAQRHVRQEDVRLLRARERFEGRHTERERSA
jgi:hypothetical protein